MKINAKPNYIYVIIGVAMVLLLLGLFGSLLVFVSQVVGSFQNTKEIIVETTDIGDSTFLKNIERNIIAGPYAKPGSVSIMTKKDIASLLTDELGDGTTAGDLSNMLSDALTFKASAPYVTRDSLMMMRLKLMQMEGVSEVYYQEDIDEKAVLNIRRIAYILLALGFLFVIVAISLIHHTVKLALYANRFLIKNMELVGASWGFISKPYLRRSVLNGILSALIAILILSGFYYFIRSWAFELNPVMDLWEYLYIFAALLFLGVLINLVSTWYIVHKYLHMRVQELF